MRTKFAQISAGFMLSVLPLAASTDCLKLADSVRSSIEKDPEQALVVVAQQVEAAPSCSCEIVKAAIQSVHADAELVAQIVEAAILAAPDQMRIISQCAIAVAPDALTAVQAVIARLDPNSGDSYSSKSAKYSGKATAKEVGPIQEEASISNPLDFPGSGPVGPGDGLPGGGLPGWDPGSDPVFPGFFPTDPVDPELESPPQP